MILGVLDLSGIDQTLGGSVRLLPLERPVSRNRVGLGLLLRFLFCLIGGPLISQSTVPLHPASHPIRHCAVIAAHAALVP